MTEKLKALRNDIIMAELDKSLFRNPGGLIFIQSDKKEDVMGSQLRHYEVLSLGPKCTSDIEIGDVILVDWTQTMPGVVLDGRKITVTTEDKVTGVLEK